MAFSSVRINHRKEIHVSHLEFPSRTLKKGPETIHWDVSHATIIDQDIIESKNHLFNLMMLAYSTHLPMSLSPDDIWGHILRICSKYVECNPVESCRSFVDFEGKKEISVNVSLPNWPDKINLLWVSIASNTVNPDAFKNLTTKFSTTNLIHSQIAKLTSISLGKEYFQMRLVLSCGFTDITLRGDLNDWKLLRSMAERLARMFPEKNPFRTYMISKIYPILDHFIQTYSKRGRYSEWWMHFISKLGKNGSGGEPFWDGWVTDLFPHVGCGFVIPNEQSMEHLTQSSVNFNAEYAGKEITFWAGAAGIYQNPSNACLELVHRVRVDPKGKFELPITDTKFRSGSIPAFELEDAKEKYLGSVWNWFVNSIRERVSKNELKLQDGDQLPFDQVDYDISKENILEQGTNAQNAILKYMPGLIQPHQIAGEIGNRKRKKMASP